MTRAQGMAIVVDEFGGTEGIVTISDIIEDILSDAAPLGDTDLDIEPLAEGRYLVNGRARLDDLSERLGFDFDASGIDTIGGYVFNQLGRVPEVGTELKLPLENHRPPRQSPANRRIASRENGVHGV